MLVTSIKWDNYRGRVASGRIYNGKIKAGQEVILINREGEMKKFRLTSLITFQGLAQTEVNEAVSGEIVAIAGIPDIMIGETIADVDNPVALPLIQIEEPTVKMTFIQILRLLPAGKDSLQLQGKSGKDCIKNLKMMWR